MMALGMLGMPTFALATSVAAVQEYSLGAQQRVPGNLYVVTNMGSIGGTVDGDVLIAAGTVALTGPVNGDVAAIGGTVQLLGPVSGDVRILGGQLSVNDRVGGDMLIAGGTLHVLPGARIDGDVYVAAGQVIIDGTINGTVRMTGGRLALNGSVMGDVRARLSQQLTIGDHAIVRGTLAYRATHEAVVPSTAQLSHAVAFDRISTVPKTSPVPGRVAWVIVEALTAISMLMLLGFTALVLWRWRRQSLEVLTSVDESFWRSLGRGVVFMILGPIAIILLLMSFVGTIAGIIAIMLFATLCIVAHVLAGMYLGAWIAKHWKRSGALHLGWVSGLGGVVLFQALGLIPVLGWVVRMALVFAVFGVLTHRAEQQLFGR